MKKLILSLSIIVCFNVSPVYAIGLGIYTSGSAGSLIHKSDNDYFGIISNPKFYTNLSVGGGFILDSNLSQKYLSYRFGFAVEKLYELQNSQLNNDYNKLIRYNIINTISIPLIVDDKFKLWIGPQFNLQFINGIYKSDISKISEYFLLMNGMPIIFKHNKLIDLLYSFGVSFGINYSLTNNFYLTAEGTFRGGFISQIKNKVTSLSKYEYEGSLLLGVCYKTGD